MKKLWKFVRYTFIVIAIGWGVLTLWVESEGKADSSEYGDATSEKKILIVYDPDPFYDLDKQVSIAFGKTMAENGIYAKVATVAAVSDTAKDQYTAYVFCSNTYNWRPDHAITNFIETLPDLKSKNVIALTLGAGSTEASQRALESVIVNSGGKIIDSRSLWLLRPNDESRLKESNVEVATSLVQSWANELAAKL